LLLALASAINLAWPAGVPAAEPDAPPAPPPSVTPAAPPAGPGPPLEAPVKKPRLIPAPLDTALQQGWDPPPADDRFTLKLRPGRAVIETTLGLIGGTIWYWRSLDFNSADWDLKWDGPSWRKKLFSTDAMRFDTNDFITNARDHSRVGGIYYLIGRANGLEMKAAFAFDLGASIVWEYMVEFKELVSINDLIINTAAGPSIGEPLLQVGTFFRRGRPTLVNRVLAIVFSPFEWLNGWLDDRPWPGDDSTDELGMTTERGHRFRLHLGGRAVNFQPGVARNDISLGVDLEVMMQKGYGQPGRWAGWLRSGALSRVTMGLTLAEDAAHLGTVFRTQTTVVGYYRQHITSDDATGGGRRGYSLMVGNGPRFDFETRRLAAETDRLAVASLFGPQLDWTVYANDILFRLEVAAYGDFALVDSHALGPETPPDPTPPLTGVLRAQGYYYAYGTTGFSRARLDVGPWTLEAELRAHHFVSIDGASRVESDLDAAFKDLTDDRLFAVGSLCFRPWRRSFGLTGFVEAVGRRGSRAAVSRSSRELSVGAALLLQL
jgi:hypothetical protein